MKYTFPWGIYIPPPLPLYCNKHKSNQNSKPQAINVHSYATTKIIMQVETTSEQSHHDPVPSSDRLIGLLDPLSFRAAANTDKGVTQKGKAQLFVFRTYIHAQSQACTCRSATISEHIMIEG